jgi:lipopolysaccharide transport system permease protein
MARYSGVAAAIDGDAIRVRFELDTPEIVGWQICDPSTGAFLFEGEWSEPSGKKIDLRVSLPQEDGPYRLQVAPVADRDRFILIDALGGGGRLEMTPPRVTTAGSMRRQHLLRSIAKAFIYPVQTVVRNRKLITSMVRRDISARYRGSFGGAMWTFLNPLLLMATYFFVFGVVLKTRFGADTSRSGFVLYFLAGMLPWLPFSEAVGRSPHVILEHRNFVKKLVFPLETLPINLVISGVVTEVFALLIFMAGLLIARGAVPGSVVWLPVLIVPQLLLTVGLCWFLAALGVFVRDLGQIIGFLLTLWFFLTPICYSETAMPAAAMKILAVNPIFVLVHGYRAIFLEDHAPDLESLIVLAAVSIVISVGGYAWFHRLRKSFADVI